MFVEEFNQDLNTMESMQHQIHKGGGRVYSGPPLTRTPFLPNKSVLIREVSFGERED